MSNIGLWRAALPAPSVAPDAAVPVTIGDSPQMVKVGGHPALAWVGAPGSVDERAPVRTDQAMHAVGRRALSRGLGLGGCEPWSSCVAWRSLASISFSRIRLPRHHPSMPAPCRAR